MDYAVYYADEGRYSRPVTLREARALIRWLGGAYIVNLNTAEVID